VIVDDFHIEWSFGSLRPLEANTPPSVDPDAVLSVSISSECLQLIAVQGAEGGEIGRGFQDLESAECLSLDSLKLWNSFAGSEIAGSLVATIEHVTAKHRSNVPVRILARLYA
jgi:hypothetical protein